MSDFLLCHGAWHGSWSWKRVRNMLTTAGHRVFTPTFTGLGERKHLLSPQVGLETHIADVINLILYEELEDIVLVGHSYGGAVAQHVADRMPERIRALMYLDAFILENGKAVMDYLPDNGAMHRAAANAKGDGWLVPPIPATVLAVNPADVSWVDRQCTPMPLKAFTDSAHLTGACHTVSRIGYIKATARAGAFDQFRQFAEGRDWWVRSLPCGHDVPIDMPHELTSLLLEFALH